MNPTAFIDILNQEDLSEFKDIKQLDRLLKNHPYFQIGLAAKSKYLRAKQHIDYVKTSRKTAVIFPDRAKLHQFLNQSVLDKTMQLDQIETNHKEITKEQQEFIPNKKSDSDLIDLPSTELEKDFLAEAINQSIQLEASVYSIEDTLDTVEDSKNSEDATLSFSEWLTGKKKTTPDQIHIKLIDEFISENPVISPVQKKEFYSPVEKGKESISDSNLPFSETLAEIFFNQGNKEMAVKGYKKLMLKYPEKSTYFAGLIKKIKES
jgi:hypothetical protein